MSRLPTFPLQAKADGLRFYVVTFGPSSAPRQSFVDMARSSADAWDYWLPFRQENERLDIQPADREPLPVQLVRNEWECQEMAAVAADLARNVNKGPRLAARNDAQALSEQVLNLDAMRRAGW